MVASQIIAASKIGKIQWALQFWQLYFKIFSHLYDLLYKEEHDILLHPTLCGTGHFVTQSNMFFVANEKSAGIHILGKLHKYSCSSNTILNKRL